MAEETRFIKYIRPGQIFDAIKKFDPKYAITRGEFSIKVPSLLIDMEWNQMDQLHRPYIHSTYQKNIRISLSRDFAISLTKWGRWPFLITVADTRMERGVYYSDFVLAGILFVHNIVTLKEVEKEVVELRHEWIINSHMIFKPLHFILSRMALNLDIRLQKEDAVIRSERYRLRKAGYSFTSDADAPDFWTANQLTNNTIYPDLPQNASIDVSALPMDTMVTCAVGAVEFLVQRKNDEVLIWPSACPHEGGGLKDGKLHDGCRLECPWHGLKFAAAQLNAEALVAEMYGFNYTLEQQTVLIHRTEKQSAAA